MANFFDTSFYDTNNVRIYPKSHNINFKTGGLEPRTNTSVLFNDFDINSFIYVPDIIQIEFDNKDSTKSRVKWLTDFQVGRYVTVVEPIPGSSSSRKISKGKVELFEVVSYDETTKTGIANVHVYIDNSGPDVLDNGFKFLHEERVITSNTTFLTLAQTNDANNKIIAFYPKFSAVNVASGNTIQLTGKFANSEIANANSSHYIVGKKIHIVSGQGPGQNATVQSYNTSTRTITTTADFDLMPSPLFGRETSYLNASIIRIGELQSTSEGELIGTFVVPELVQRTINSNLYGWKYFQKVNSWYNSFFIFTTNKIEFTSYTSQRPQLAIVSGTIDVELNVGEKPKANVDSIGGGTLISSNKLDQSTTPFAQTFYVDDKINPQGIFITSVRLLFRSKDINSTHPVQIQIRPTKSSIPDSSLVISGSDAFIKPIDINVLSEDTLKILNNSNIDPFSNSSYYSTATFERPVYLPSGKEYALIVMSKSNKNEIYISSLGEKILGTSRTISSQPYIGVLYKSQGTSGWTPSANEDLAFQIMKAKFSGWPAIVDFQLKNLPSNLLEYGRPGFFTLEETAPFESVNVHSIYVEASQAILPNTKSKYEFSIVRPNGIRDEFKPILLDSLYEFDDNYGTRILNEYTDSFVLRAYYYTSNPDVAPIIDTSGFKLYRMENDIDDCSLLSTDLFVTDPGKGYSNGSNVIVTISGGGGTGATAKALVASNTVIALEIINGGSGYTGSPNVIISRDTTATVNAKAIIIGEDQQRSKVAKSKYITKKIALADGFEGGDLRVMFNAIKPRNTEIHVYYKVLSPDDFDSFENKKWNLMTVIGGINDYSLTRTDYKAYMYAPGKNNIADNYIVYDGFTSFKYYAIKIIFRSKDPIKIPIVRDFRVVALTPLLT